MSDDRCFCGAEWNDVAEECVDGHAFGDEDRLRVENGNLRAEIDRLRAGITPAEDLRDADLDRMTARECFGYLSRGLDGGEAAILKAVAMTRAHERKKRRP